MDLKDRRRSLTRGTSGKEMHYATSSLDSENCHIVSQKSYSSSKTLKAYQQDGRLRYGACVAELVHQETEEYVRQGSFALADLGMCEPPPPSSVYCSDISLLQDRYSLNAVSDADSDPEGVMTPERAVQLWSRQPLKSRRSSCLSSPDHSVLTLTDSENEHKTDEESGLREGRMEKQRLNGLFSREEICTHRQTEACGEAILSGSASPPARPWHCVRPNEACCNLTAIIMEMEKLILYLSSLSLASHRPREPAVLFVTPGWSWPALGGLSLPLCHPAVVRCSRLKTRGCKIESSSPQGL
ncbi:teneurin-2-like [Danio aesculapii]|uniref:teneurin-2-like n=1 Tax=Danio aesculapii TaxID=1142201 RepID=UPI0024C076D4|nr:teneurin-2-like [Danio aesculapii]